MNSAAPFAPPIHTHLTFYHRCVDVLPELGIAALSLISTVRSLVTSAKRIGDDG